MAAGGEKGQQLLSPLRYPGGKRKLAGYIAEAIRMNDLHPKLFVEPFAGGASVSLYLLEQGLVDQIALGEKDELVAAFWKEVFYDHEWLVDQIAQIEPTLELWNAFRQSEPQTDRERALKCLFLNRTSFSGILSHTAGPLGGQKQSSRYPIGCRFYPQTVIQRIQTLAELADKVRFLHFGGWEETIQIAIETGLEQEEVFYYLDPPFYDKADRLYRYWFNLEGHQFLYDYLARIQASYILSYDAAQPIIDLYCENGVDANRVEILYSANANGKRKAQELIISNLPKLPRQS